MSHQRFLNSADVSLVSPVWDWAPSLHVSPSQKSAIQKKIQPRDMMSSLYQRGKKVERSLNIFHLEIEHFEIFEVSDHVVHERKQNY